jgi:uncharacterized protein (TIGR00369 family)
MNFRTHIPFVEAMGFELLRLEGGEAEIGLTPRADQMNGLGVLHGGVAMTLLDVAMAHATRSAREPAAPEAFSVMTVEMKTTFMRPGTGRLRAHGKALTLTSSLGFCEGSLFDTQNRLVAHATGTFKFLRPRNNATGTPVPTNGSD